MGNPEAVEWLESLPDDERNKLFTPIVASGGELFTLKRDHEGAGWVKNCPACNYGRDLVIVE